MKQSEVNSAQGSVTNIINNLAKNKKGAPGIREPHLVNQGSIKGGEKSYLTVMFVRCLSEHQSESGAGKARCRAMR